MIWSFDMIDHVTQVHLEKPVCGHCCRGNLKRMITKQEASLFNELTSSQVSVQMMHSPKLNRYSQDFLFPYFLEVNNIY